MYFEPNICELSDSYKLGHHSQYMPNTAAVYAYYESRYGAMFANTVFFGAQWLIKTHLIGRVVTRNKIEEAAEACAELHKDDTIFNRVMWDHILMHHNGYLPIKIRAVPEGTVVPTGNIMMDIENTDKSHECHALTGHLETLLCQLWYPCTIATLSREVKKLLVPWFDKTVDTEDYWKLDYMLHDFGMRGASCMEAAGIGGLAHLVNFSGTDNMQALRFGRNFYNSKGLGGSIIATEHSVMGANGREGESSVVRHILQKHPKGPISLVGDTFDIYNFCENIIGGTCRDLILNRPPRDMDGAPGVVIIRPDSDEPVPVLNKCLDILTSMFGASRNSKGYRVLCPKVRVMWGDGLNLEAINTICSGLAENKWSLSNIGTFGMGGGLLQRVHRDNQRFKFACSAQERDGVWRDIYKDPVIVHQGSESTKTSKGGRLTLVRNGRIYTTVRQGELCLDDHEVMDTIYEDGVYLMMANQTMSEIRWRAEV